VSSTNAPLIRFTDRVRPIAATGLDLIGFEGLDTPALQLLEEFDSIVSWYGTNRPEFRDIVSHLPFTFYPALPPESRIHAVDFYMRQVGGCDGAVPKIDCPRHDQGFLAIHPFSGSPKKNWPIESYHKLARAWLSRFCVGPEEEFPGAVRLDDLYAVAEWLATAHVYVGNDSGISHLAAAVGTPVVAIFRATDPAVWAPRGSAVIVLRDPDVDEVAAAIDTLW
jgi:heptosyltransferase-3